MQIWDYSLFCSDTAENSSQQMNTVFITYSPRSGKIEFWRIVREKKENDIHVSDVLEKIYVS